MTYIRDAEAAPEVLKSAANAMRHQLATANSDKYDRRTHDRLNESAVAFAESVARKFTSAPIPEGYALVPDQPPSFACVKGEAGSYACTIEWFASLRADTTYRFATVPGRNDGFDWRTPIDAVGKTLSITISPCDLTASKFTVTNLLVKTEEERLAPTELIDEADRPVVGDVEEEDDWQPIEAELTATRAEGDAFTIALPHHPLLISNCEVRVVDASVVDAAVRLPEAPTDAAYEISVRVPDAASDQVTLSGLQVKRAAPVAKVRPGGSLPSLYF